MGDDGSEAASASGAGGDAPDDPLVRHYRYSKVASVFDRMDVGGNGSISFAEFLTQVERLTPDEILAARGSFDLLGPDRDGNVRKRKYIDMQIAAFEDVLDPEFNRWVQIMNHGTVVHAHRRKDLEAAGVDIPEDFIEPPSFSLVRLLAALASAGWGAVNGLVFATSRRRRDDAYAVSAQAHERHVKKMYRLRHRLAQTDKAFLDDEDAAAIAAFESKLAESGRHRVRVKKEPRKRPGASEVAGAGAGRRGGRRGGNRVADASQAQAEGKMNEEGLESGGRQGNEMAVLDFEDSDARILRAREQHRAFVERRVVRDMAGGNAGSAGKAPVGRGPRRDQTSSFFADAELRKDHAEPDDGGLEAHAPGGNNGHAPLALALS